MAPVFWGGGVFRNWVVICPRGREKVMTQFASGTVTSVKVQTPPSWPALAPDGVTSVSWTMVSSPELGPGSPRSMKSSWNRMLKRSVDCAVDADADADAEMVGVR